MGLLDSLKRAVFGPEAAAPVVANHHRESGNTGGTSSGVAVSQSNARLSPDYWISLRLAERISDASDKVIEPYKLYLAGSAPADIALIVDRLWLPLRSVDDNEFFASIRVVRALGPKAAPLAPLLLEYANEETSSFRRSWAVMTLGLIGAGAAIALPRLNAIARSTDSSRQRAMAQAAIDRISKASDETPGQEVVRRFVEHLKSQGLAPTVDPYEDGSTWDVTTVIDGAQYRIQIMDPAKGALTMAWRVTPENEITLGTEENADPTDTDRRVLQLCGQVDQGKFTV